MIRTHRTALLADAVAAAFPAVARAIPINHYYVGPDNSLFSSAANWSLSANGPGGSPPAANDNAILSPATTKTVTLDATPGNVPLTTLSLTPSGTASVTLNQTAANLSLATFLFGPRATYNQLGGNATATGALTIDATASSYNLSSLGSLTAAGLTLGATAAGTFTQSAGTASFTAVGNGTLRVGGLGPGLLSLAGGTLADTSAVLDSYLSASLAQTGGTHTVSLPGLLLGQNASYSLSAGSLNVAGPLTIGGKGTYPTGSPAITADAGATFNQTGGTVTLSGTSPLVIDSNPGSSARYSLSAGSILLPGHPDITIGSSRTGTFAQSGGTVDNTFNNGSAHSTTYLAKNAGSSASFSLANTAQFATAAFNAAVAGSASITQTGGTLTCYWATFAQTPGSSASYNISAGTFAPSSVIYGGQSGSAYFTQTGGTVGPTGTTFFAYNSGSFASYSLSGTGSLKGFETYVGDAGIATFAQSGGTHSAGFLAIAYFPSSSATYSLSAGSLSATSMSIGPSGGLGTLTQSGGTVTLTNTTASSFLNLGSAGALKLSGGTLSAASTRDAILNGRVTHSGGALSLPNANLRLGTTGTAAAYSLSNTAALTAKTLTIGESAPATFTQTGGAATVTSVTISASGRYTLSGGALLLDYPTTSPASQIRSYLAAGLLATPSSVPSTSRIAYIESSQLPVSRWSTPAWSIPDNTTLLVTLTLTGDANLDGKLNADDYALLDRSYAKSLTNALWTDGDFNYDGALTSTDYLLIDSTLGSQAALSSEFLSLRESQFGADYVAQLLTSVPEPSSAACLLAGWVALAGRRRRVESEDWGGKNGVNVGVFGEK